MYVGNPYLQFAGAGFTGLLDTYTGATVAYSVRWLNSAYSGALVRIRRASDSAEKDFYPDSNNELSLNSEDGAGTSLSFWIGADSGYIATWYDQSTAGGTGSGNDLSRGIASSQPRIVNAGTLETDPNNGNVAVFFDGSNDYMNLGSAISLTQNYYQHFVFNRGSSGIISCGITDNNANPFVMLWFSNNGIYSGTTSSPLHDASQTGTGDFIQTTLRDGSNNTKMWRNGSADTTQTNSGTTGTYDQAFNRNGNYHNGYVQELIYWNSDQESNQGGIESNANSYFGVF